MITAREAALLTLYEVFNNGAYSNLALKECMAKNKRMAPAEKALLTNLVYGVVSRHYTLIYIIRKYSSIQIKKINDYILIILELGLYQLIYTDKIPESAAVNESVKLAKKYDKGGSGFVNAILRSFCRGGKKIEYPDSEEEYLSVKYSYSTAMTRLFTDNFGTKRAASIMAALNEPSKLIIRANILKIGAAELKERLLDRGIDAELCGGELVRTAGFDISTNDLYNSGLFSVQDSAAYMAAIILEPQPGETIIDMCAAPGGKSTHIAELQGDKGRIIACDIHKHKIKLVEESAKRLGLTSISAKIADGTHTDSLLKEIADRVLCDVPCSGLGIIRRKPDIKLGRTEVTGLPELQLSILKNGAQYLKHGGVLVYSTCTINCAENGDVVKAFLDNNNEFEKLYEKTFYPDEDGTDGFYICKMKRK